jgi:hypothetical protein
MRTCTCIPQGTLIEFVSRAMMIRAPQGHTLAPHATSGTRQITTQNDHAEEVELRLDRLVLTRAHVRQQSTHIRVIKNRRRVRHHDDQHES